MTGAGVLQHKDVFTYCYGYLLNLAANDAIKEVTVVKDVLDITNEIRKLIKFSPQHDTVFEKLKADLTPGKPGIWVLFPTRWTVQVDSLQNHRALLITTQ